jgi:NADPH:quinone reductase-like Zn-dependent oxidoreductase
MRAWQLHPGFNSLEGLQQTTLPTPEPGPHEVLVRVRACSLNYRDQLIVVGKYSAAGPLLAPQVPLSDGAGEIAAVGSAVTRWRVGDRVASCFFPAWRDGRPDPSLSAVSLGAGGAPGMLAEFVALPESAIVAMASNLSFEQAATLPCARLWEPTTLRGSAWTIGPQRTKTPEAPEQSRSRIRGCVGSRVH